MQREVLLGGAVGAGASLAVSCSATSPEGTLLKMMTAPASDHRIALIRSLLDGKADGRYGLHDVTQRQHALQAAMFAERDGHAPSLIAAALLHDVGHLVHDLGENPAARGVDDRHEQVGHDFLIRWFGPEVAEPVRLHVAAKRFLCATEADYFGQLSEDSVLSLSLQGGPMSEVQAAAFRALPHWRDAVQLRRYEEMAKVMDLPTPPTAHFLPFVAACLKLDRRSWE